VIDTHAHLDPVAAPELISRARAVGVTRIVTVSTTIEGGREALALADRTEGIWVSVGIHPHEAGVAADIDTLRELLAHPKAVAVGETGLDFFRDYAPRHAQRELFDAQLELARALGKPVVVHTRAADDETRALLVQHEGEVVLHCFSSPDLLGDALEHGWYVSFAGNVTYPNAGELREAARRVPADRLLAETDSPYLAPQAVRGRTNEPANVVHTLAVLADTRGTTTDELAAQIDANATAVFDL
jgi:TatD DNase family protein